MAAGARDRTCSTAIVGAGARARRRASPRPLLTRRVGLPRTPSTASPYLDRGRGTAAPSPPETATIVQVRTRCDELDGDRETRPPPRDDDRLSDPLVRRGGRRARRAAACLRAIAAISSTIPGGTRRSRCGSTTKRGRSRRCVAACADAPPDGILAVGDRPTVLAAHAGARVRPAGQSAGGAAASRNKLATRARVQAAGLPTPCVRVGVARRRSRGAGRRDRAIRRCVKPLALSGSRGVMRVDDAARVRRGVRAAARAAAVAGRPRSSATRRTTAVLVEAFIPGASLPSKAC